MTRPVMQEQDRQAANGAALLDMQDMPVTNRHLPRTARPAGGKQGIAGGVVHAMRYSIKRMHLSLWQGENHSDTQCYREDLQRRHGDKGAVLCAE